MNQPLVTGSRFGTVIGWTLILVTVFAVTMFSADAGSAEAGSVDPAVALPAAPLQADGATVYEQRCASCHQPGGVGIVGTFPPLAGNPAAGEPAYVDDVIRNGLSGPIEVDGVAYDAAMPAVDLSDDERTAVVDYVVGLAGSASTSTDGTSDESAADETAAEPGTAQPTVGDVDRGRRLFTGSIAFENRGGACGSCHEAGDVGHWGGSSLGPDLDAAYTDLGGEAGLTAWLAAPPSPTMQPVFADRPLTEPEIADLVTFLESAPERQRSQTYGDRLLLGAAIGLVVLFGGMAAARRTMSPSYSQRLRGKR